MRLLPQITACGEWPFAFMYHIHSALRGLLRDIARDLHVLSTAVVCAACRSFDLPLSAARSHSAAVPCWVCKTRGSVTAMPVQGFVTWEDSAAQSAAGSLVDTALVLARNEAAKHSRVAASHVKHANDKLRR